MRVVFIADEFAVRTPVQQLLDRFLMGYPRQGAFHRPQLDVVLVTPARNGEIERRIKDFGLRWQRDPEAGDATVLFTRVASFVPAARCFVYGVPNRDLPGAIAGTAVRGAWLLPEIAVTQPEKGLVIVQGEYPQAEMEALDALLPLIWRAGARVRKVARLGAKDFWPVLKREFWPLVKSAVSRSDSPQGDPVRDGRTQDLAGLGLLETLVKAPRGWLIEQEDGLRYVIAVMDGGVADYNVAVQSRSGGIVSAQVHRPPAPAEHHFSRLAAMLEKYFRTGVLPWPVEQTSFTAELLDRFADLQGERKR